jgi:hypothetical protein
MDFTWVTTDDANAIQNSIVDAKGDLISATANDTPARLAVGANGETLVADSSATTGLRWQGDYAAGKNKIINGDMGIWQRGTSFTNPQDAFSADRFKHYITASAPSTYTVTRQTFTPGAAPVAGYEGQYFMRVTAPSSGTITEIDIAQPIEDVRTFAGQTVTLSFWAKSSANLSLKSLAQQRFDSVSGNVGAGTQVNSLTTSWQRFTHTISIPSTSGKTIGNASSLYIFFFTDGLGTIANSQTIDLWGVQLEAGSVATAFQTATGTLQGELAACQRYFQRLVNGAEQSLENLGIFQCLGTTSGIGSIQFLAPMRTAPTMSVSSAGHFERLNASGTQQALTAFTFQQISPRRTRADLTWTSGTTAGDATDVIANSASATLDASAEL